MNIQKAVISDATEILFLQKLSYLSEAEIYNDYEIPPLTQSLPQLLDEFKTHDIYKVVINGKIVGSVRGLVEDGICTIHRLIVHPDYQNRGIGSSLIRKIEENIKHCTRYELFTGHKSEKNIRLYQKLGYHIYKVEKLTNDIDMVYLSKDTYVAKSDS